MVIVTMERYGKGGVGPFEWLKEGFMSRGMTLLYNRTNGRLHIFSICGV